MEPQVLIKMELMGEIKNALGCLIAFNPEVRDVMINLDNKVNEAISSAPDAVIPIEKAHEWGNCILSMKGYNQEQLCARWGNMCEETICDGLCPQITKE